eukprot:8820591-Alexandrium_andersonii.AAC.1
MSASLVGSEMCIRDRSTTARISCWTPSVPGLRAGSRPPPNQAPFADAVSYTHLTLPTICSV